MVYVLLTETPMNSWLLAITGYLLAGCSLLAAPLKMQTLAVGSTTFTNVTILGANATDLFFTYNQGIMNVKLRYLDAALQKQFDYDPARADSIERKQAAEDLIFRSHFATTAAQARKVAAAAAAKASAEAVSSSAENLADPISNRSIIGKSFPDFKVDKWIGEKPDLSDRFVLISFWEPRSSSSKKWIPMLNDLQKKFGDKLAVVGITSESELEVSQMEGPVIEFPCGIDLKGSIAAAADVTSVPYVLLLDTQHVVRYAGHPAALTPELLQSTLQNAE